MLIKYKFNNKSNLSASHSFFSELKLPINSAFNKTA